MFKVQMTRKFWSIQNLSNKDSFHEKSDGPNKTFLCIAELQRFRVADFATLSDEAGCLRKLFYCLIWIKEPCIQNTEGLTHLKVLGILQTVKEPLIPVFNLFLLLGT